MSGRRCSEGIDMNMHEVATAVAAHLPGWEAVCTEYDPNDRSRRALLRHEASGAECSLHKYSNRPKACCKARVPHEYTPYKATVPEANFSPERPAKTLARDLERRVLTPAISLHAECERRRIESETAADRMEKGARAMAETFEKGDCRCDFRYSEKHCFRVERGDYDEHDDRYVDGTIEHRYNGRVEMKLTVSADMAAKIAALIAKAK